MQFMQWRGYVLFMKISLHNPFNMCEKVRKKPITIAVVSPNQTQFWQVGARGNFKHVTAPAYCVYVKRKLSHVQFFSFLVCVRCAHHHAIGTLHRVAKLTTNHVKKHLKCHTFLAIMVRRSFNNLYSNVWLKSLVSLILSYGMYICNVTC